MNNVISYDVIDRGDNLSDHSPIVLSLSGSLNYVERDVLKSESPRLCWRDADERSLNAYRRRLSDSLSEISVPADAILCSDHLCRCPSHTH